MQLENKFVQPMEMRLCQDDAAIELNVRIPTVYPKFEKKRINFKVMKRRQIQKKKINKTQIQIFNIRFRLREFN